MQGRVISSLLRSPLPQRYGSLCDYEHLFKYSLSICDLGARWGLNLIYLYIFSYVATLLTMLGRIAALFLQCSSCPLGGDVSQQMNQHTSDCSCRVQQLKGSPFLLFFWCFCSRLCGEHCSDASQRPTWMEKSKGRWGYESSVVTWWRQGCNLKVFVGDVFRIKPVKFEPFWTNTHKQTAVPGSTLCDTKQNIKNLLAIRSQRHVFLISTLEL